MSPAVPRPVASWCVLIVDDDALCRRALARGIRGVAGARVVEASTLAEARAALAAVDVVLTDVDLVGEDGLALLQHATVPVIVTSGNEARFAEARQRGAVATLRKPLALAELVAALALVSPA